MLDELKKNDTANVKRLLTAWADGDVLTLREYGYLIAKPERQDFIAHVLTKYKEFRETNPEFYDVPTYLSDQEAFDWKNQIIKIDRYLKGMEKAKSKDVK